MCNAFGKALQAIFKTSVGGSACGFPVFIFCKAVTRYISLNISRALLPPGPSVPRATGTLFSRSLHTSATPLDNLQFAAGFVTVSTFLSFKISISLSVRCTPWKIPPP